jgi:hypothetical protein
MLVGLATLRLGMAANGAFGLALTLPPAALRREFDDSMDPLLALWITVAVFLHSVGSLGPYQWFSWYDSVTHTTSAVLIGGVGYAAFRAFEEHSDALDVDTGFRALFILVFVLAASVVWELLEFASVVVAPLVGAEAPLAVYGIDDIVTIWGTGYFDGLARFFRRRL